MSRWHSRGSASSSQLNELGLRPSPSFMPPRQKRGVSVPVGGVIPGQQSSEALSFAHMNDLHERFLLDELPENSDALLLFANFQKLFPVEISLVCSKPTKLLAFSRSRLL